MKNKMIWAGHDAKGTYWLDHPNCNCEAYVKKTEAELEKQKLLKALIKVADWMDAIEKDGIIYADKDFVETVIAENIKESEK